MGLYLPLLSRTWRIIRMRASLNFVPKAPCLPHPSSTPAWHPTWSSAHSCLNSTIKIQLKCSHSQGDIFHPIHIVLSVAFDTMSLPFPKALSFYKLSWSSCLGSVLLKPSNGHSPLRAPQGLVSCLLIFNSIKAVSFQNGSHHRLCALGSLNFSSSSDFTLYFHLNWEVRQGHRLNCFSSSDIFFFTWWHHTVTQVRTLEFISDPSLSLASPWSIHHPVLSFSFS